MKSNVIVNGLSIPTKVEEFEDSNILEVEAGTNGLQNEGATNGAKTYFRIKDLGRTKMQCDFEPMGKGNEVCEVTITLDGDAELRTFLKGLKFAAETLENQTETRVFSVTFKDEEIAVLFQVLQRKIDTDNSFNSRICQKIKNKLERRYRP